MPTHSPAGGSAATASLAGVCEADSRRVVVGCPGGGGGGDTGASAKIAAAATMRAEESAAGRRESDALSWMAVAVEADDKDTDEEVNDSHVDILKLPGYTAAMKRNMFLLRELVDRYGAGDPQALCP
mmetsp:Transcript_112397/g.314074  ORF Transcript_112397/g.314074 Transcript_112397/m.314074 type:complete len:127 (-) Transcript_112397:74-454(-)